MVDQIDNNPSLAPPQTHRNNSRGKYRSVHLAPSDEVIAALANAPENRRARQVSEWERMIHRRLDPSCVA